MITVEVEDHCQRCPFFEPAVDKIYHGDIAVDTVIRCVNEKKCQLIEKIRRGG